MSHTSSLRVLTDPQPDPQTPSDPSLFSRERQATFLANLAATGQVRSASARAGVSHQTAYRARLASPGFRRAWDAALLAARAQAEEMLACRALEGWEEDVVYHGEVVATRRRWSDRLLLAHLARLDKLCGDAEVAVFADAFEDNLASYAAGEDRPARAAAEAEGHADGEGAVLSSGERSRRSNRGQAHDECADDDGVPPPLPEARDCDGAIMDEAQQLEVGLYRFHYLPDGETLVTNWPAPPGFCGQWYRVASDEAEAEPIARDPLDPDRCDDGEDWPGPEEAFRALLPEEAAGIARTVAAPAAARAARLALYGRSACGLATAAEEASLRAANPGGCWPR